MRINSYESSKLAKEVLNHYGDWGRMRDAGTRNADGIIVLPPRSVRIEAEKAKRQKGGIKGFGILPETE